MSESGPNDCVLNTIEVDAAVRIPQNNRDPNDWLVAHNKKLRCEVSRLRAELVLAAEKERRAIGADLHDSLGQLLMAWRIRIRAAIGTVEDSAIREMLAPIAGEIADASEQLRTLIFDLTSPVLVDSGLSAALRDLAQRKDGQAGLTVTFAEDGDPHLLAEATSVLLYRAARELVFNATKHSGGTHATLTLSWKPTGIQVVVSDNGRGMAQNPKEHASGSGLFCIRDALARMGGKLHITSVPGRRCTVAIEMPTKEEEEG